MSVARKGPEAHPAPEEGSRSGTREALLDAAEILFANAGIVGTSLRAITSQAGANLAAVNYHFGNKEGLVRAVFERRIGPINQLRLRSLDEIEAASGPSDLDAILRAFLAPVLAMGARPSTAHFKRLLGRIFTDPGEEMRSLFMTQFEEVANRFALALSRALPDLPRDILIWRFHFMLGSMVQMAHGGPLIVAHSEGLCDPSHADEVIDRLVEFVAAGFQAPAAPSRALQARTPKAQRNEPTQAPTTPSRGTSEDGSEGIFAWEDGF